MTRQYQLKSLKIKNFRSFYSEQVLDFYVKNKVNTVTAIYGPNSSGKSNTAIALFYIYNLILNSTNASLLQVPYDPFKLKTNSASEDSEFELTLTSQARNFVYSFRVNSERISHESLVELSDSFNRPKKIFTRDYNPKTKGYDYSSASVKNGFGKAITESTRPGSLLITKAREFNNEYSNLIFAWINNINVLIGETPALRGFAAQVIENDPVLKEGVLKLLQDVDLWIRAFNIDHPEMPSAFIESLPFVESEKIKMRGQTGTEITTTHAVRDKDGNIVGDALFQMSQQESVGTNRLFDLAAPIVDTLTKGMILYLDEFGAHIHPDISRYLLQLFADPKVNTKGAQLIINTHDTYLMAPGGSLGRDNIILVEKNMNEESIIRPLSQKDFDGELGSVRNNEQYEKRYRQGLYGARPYIKGENE